MQLNARTTAHRNSNPVYAHSREALEEKLATLFCQIVYSILFLNSLCFPVRPIIFMTRGEVLLTAAGAAGAMKIEFDS